MVLQAISLKAMYLIADSKIKTAEKTGKICQQS
jgi:hypothetical protein